MSENTANRIFNTVNVILIIITMVLCLAPFIHIIAISLSSNRAIGSGEVSFFPKELSFEAYTKVFADGSMIRSLIYTIWLTVLSTVLSMVMTIAAAYPLAKSNLKGRKWFMLVIVVTMFFSGGIIPEYILIKNLHLLDSTWGLILPGLISPFYMIILITFFRGIPESLEEAAGIDGSSHFGTLMRIILPLSLPVMATLSLFYAVGRWNGFQDALMYITKPELYPLQLKLYQMIQQNQITELMQNEGIGAVQVLPESLKAASVIFSTLPILLVYPWLQRYFISGVMVGAVKG
ncbi:carbohydrate ABC transporter permease [Paenibacillus sp. FSL H7-0942]|uniref:carbohydrate ABC transporter permease n=1 Tax=Paenibacillus TaxID=44249 RepID=UPI00096DF139|nr:MULTISPECIES: carbohydrate ABC transporter permease [Paenibacillus]MBY0119556.1 carbohydrate ABC transporter permease [Paenibacillus xylanexedens]MCF7754847.1 carbohydrate ABC transporter permease [Paenibacillus xylanexedens]MDQ0656790.1 putative aldouronate transport system permease protein [Paenibacillus sp. W2I17]MDQ0720871.1 putative aldouronate transport system permease protein [Paenibacillus sp. W4I10]OMF02242.1 ABC transporter permease [Paenibacillus amylolyticus]